MGIEPISPPLFSRRERKGKDMESSKDFLEILRMMKHDFRSQKVPEPLVSMEVNLAAGKCRACGELLVSWHRHDFVACSCGKSFVDGGYDYFRAGGEVEPKPRKGVVEMPLSLAQKMQEAGSAVPAPAIPKGNDDLVERLSKEKERIKEIKDSKPFPEMETPKAIGKPTTFGDFPPLWGEEEGKEDR